jgi:hypothetical protein
VKKLVMVSQLVSVEGDIDDVACGKVMSMIESRELGARDFHYNVVGTVGDERVEELNRWLSWVEEMEKAGAKLSEVDGKKVLKMLRFEMENRKKHL